MTDWNITSAQMDTEVAVEVFQAVSVYNLLVYFTVKSSQKLSEVSVCLRL